MTRLNSKVVWAGLIGGALLAVAALAFLPAVTLLAVPAGLLGSLVAPPFVPRVANRG